MHILDIYFLYPIGYQHSSENLYLLLFDDNGCVYIYEQVYGAKRYEPTETRWERRKFQTVKKQYVF
jgi:hypothetical protein